MGIENLFNTQIVESVQLLSMTEPKDDYGYYALKGEFHFGKALESNVLFPRTRNNR